MEADGADFYFELANGVDRISRLKAGKLAAYGLSESQIADALLLSKEQVIAIQPTQEYKKGYSEQVAERVDRSIDLEEGWDAVEEKALKNVLEAIEYNRDPKFALMAASVANKAQRRTPSGASKPIDATKAGNVVAITINKVYVNNAAKNGGIDVNSTRREILTKKMHDVPTPQVVQDLLEDKSEDPNRAIDLDFDKIDEVVRQALE